MAWPKNIYLFTYLPTHLHTYPPSYLPTFNGHCCQIGTTTHHKFLDVTHLSSLARVYSTKLFQNICEDFSCQILSFIQPVGRTGFFSLSLLSLCEGLIPTIIGFRTLSCNLDKCTKQCRQKYCAILTNFDNFAHQPPTHLVLLLSSYFLSMEARAKEQYRGSIHGVVAIETCSMFIVFCLVGQNLVKIDNQIH